MQDQDKTKQQLIDELTELRSHVADLLGAQKALREESSKYCEMIDRANEAIYVIQDGWIKFANQACSELTGYSAKEILAGNSIESLVHPDDRDTVAQFHARRLQGDTAPHRYDLRVLCKDGSLKWVEMKSAPIMWEGRPAGLGVVTDITDRKRIEDGLRKSEEKFQLLFQNAPVGYQSLDENGYILDVNQVWLDILGYSGDDVTGRWFGEFLHPEQKEVFRKLFPINIQRHDVIRGVEFCLLRKGGAPVIVDYTATIARDERGRFLRTHCVFQDITEHRAMERQLRRSEERYRSLVEGSFDGIFIQKGSKIVFANSRLYEMLGYSPGELEGIDHWLVYHPDYQDITRERAATRMRGEDVPHQYEVMLQKKDGSSFLGEINARTVQVDQLPGVQVWIRDISGRRRSEEAQRRLAIAIEQATDAIFITDPQGNIQYVNPAFERITGYVEEDVHGEKPSLFRSEEYDPAYIQSIQDTLARGESWGGRLTKRRKDGASYEEDVTVTPVRNASGTIINFVGVKRDVTRESGLQRQLVQAQKMEAVGTLAGGIAHDFNNLLQSVLGYAEFMLQRKKEGEHDYNDLQKIYQAGMRGADLVKSLMAFSQKVETKYIPVDLNQEIVQVQDLLSRTIPKTVTIDLHLSGDLELINADPSQICQVLMNLGVNARDAMPDGGTLSIETVNIELDEEYCSDHLETIPGGYVLLTVSDTGQGMDKKTVSHIFEPFFTTKELGKGTGLGLSMVYGIVKQHGGQITCYSEPGHGTTFKIYFPAIQQEKTSEPQTADVPIQRGTETILLAEDEESISELGAALLNEFGYEVITAGNGEEALRIYKREGDIISLIILDLIMPIMDGRQCLAEILRINQDAKVVIVSGYSESGPVSSAMTVGAKGFIEKPYNMRKLLTTVRDVLDKD